MNNSEQLKLLVEKVRSRPLPNGKKMTQKKIAELLNTNDKYLSGLLNGKEDVTDKFLHLFKSVFSDALSDDAPDVEVNANKLANESQLSSIEANIKLNYVIGLLAEVQEKLDQSKTATGVASRVQRLVQSDLVSAVKRLQS